MSCLKKVEAKITRIFLDSGGYAKNAPHKYFGVGLPIYSCEIIDADFDETFKSAERCIRYLSEVRALDIEDAEGHFKRILKDFNVSFLYEEDVDGFDGDLEEEEEEEV